MNASQATILSFDRFVLDRADERLIGPDGPIRIGTKAFRVLVRLIEQNGRLLTKEELFASVWDGTFVSESALTSVIKELRRALGDNDRPPRLIESVYGRGYRFLVAVETGSAAMARPEPATGAAAPAAAPEAIDQPPVILVSAFDCDAVRAAHPHIAAGLREEVLSALARFREIQLVADSRSEAAAEADRRAIGARDYHLTATLVPHGDGIKAIARAKKLANGRVVWGETMLLAETGTAAGVERIVRRIIGCALPAVDEDQFLALSREPDTIYDRYLRAKRVSLTTTSHAEARRAAAALENIILEKPDFLLAYPPLIRLYNIDFNWTALGSTGPEERARALALAKRCLAADRGNAHAHTVLGFCHLWHGEFDIAQDCFARAVELNPYNPVRLNEAATGYLFLGAFDRAEALYDHSIALNAQQDDAYYEDRMHLALMQGRPEAVPELARRMTGKLVWASLYQAIAASLLGDPSAPAHIEGWRDQVAKHWEDGRVPDEEAILAWTASYHPFPPELQARFMALVEEAFRSLRRGSARTAELFQLRAPVQR